MTLAPRARWKKLIDFQFVNFNRLNMGLKSFIIFKIKYIYFISNIPTLHYNDYPNLPLFYDMSYNNNYLYMQFQYNNIHYSKNYLLDYIYFYHNSHNQDN